MHYLQHVAITFCNTWCHTFDSFHIFLFKLRYSDGPCFIIRGKISDELEDFILEDDRNKFVLELEDAENWLYEDGVEADKPVYQVMG